VSTASDTETAAWTTAFSGPTTSNVYSSSIAIPFSFDFYGMPVDYLKVAPNGFLTFDTLATALPTADEPLPSTALPPMSVAAFWDDFANVASGDIIRWKVFGTAPNRQLWVKWHSMTYGTATFAYMAVVLDEATQDIHVVDMYALGATGPARVGVQLDAANFAVGSNTASLGNYGTSNGDNDYYTFSPLAIGEDARAQRVTLSAGALGGCGGSVEPVSVDLLNGGTVSLAGLVATLEVDGSMVAMESVPGSIPSGGASTYTFTATADLSGAGPHTVRAYVTSGADVNPSNDTAMTSVTTVGAVTLPIFNDFTGFTGSNLPTVFPGWYEANDFGVPDSGSSSWVRNDFGNDPNSPNGSAARVNLYTTSFKEWILSPKFLVEPNTQLRYDLALTTFSGTTASTFGSDDVFQVLISTDCGASFTALQTFDATTPVSNTGQLEAVSLNAYAGQDVIIGFYADDGTTDDPEDYNVYVDNIQLFVPSPIDISVGNLALDPGCLGNAETVTADLFNAGTAVTDFTTDSIEWTLQIDGPTPQTITGTINTGTLAVGATQTVTLTTMADLGAAGSYDLTFTIDLAADGLASNDTTATSVSNATTFNLPVGPVDFTGFTGANLPTLFPGWYEANNVGVPDSGNSSWIRDDFGNDPNHPNGSAARVNLYTTSFKEWILSPKFLVGAGAQLSYDLALTAFTGTAAGSFGSDDVFQVLISTDCGASFTALQTFDASTTVSNTGQQEIVDLSAYVGQEVIIGFYADDGTTDDPGDYNVYVDNILIQLPPAIDLAVSSLAVLPLGSCYSSNDPVEVILTSLGTDALDFAQDSFIATLNITGPIPQTITDTLHTGILLPNETLTLTTAADFSLAGTYVLTYVVSNPNDGASFNDTLSITVEVVLFTAPYFEPFDAFTGTTGFGAGWERSPTSGYRWLIEDGATPTANTGAGQDHTSGTGKYVFTESSNGAQGDTALLISPCIDLSALTTPQLDFYWHMYGDSMGTFEVLVDDGTGQTVIFSQVGEQDTAEADIDPWNYASLSLSAYVGQTIRLIFSGQRGNDFTGDISVDDVFIYEETGIDIQALAATIPPTACEYEVDSEITVDVVNATSNLLDFATNPLTVSADITGALAQLVTNTLSTGTLAAGDTLSVSLTADFTTAGLYEVLIFTQVLADQNPYNDTLLPASTRSTLPLYVAPYSEDFEAFVPSSSSTDPGELTFDWSRNRIDPLAWFVNSGTTVSSATGPNGDHTTGTGNYLYTEASTPAGAGDTAILMSSCIALTQLTAPVLTFWYHMYGEDIGTLFVEVENEQGDVLTVWSLSGEQQTGNAEPYEQAIAPLVDFIGDTVMLRIVGTYGGNFDGDIAIDDIEVKEATDDALRALRVSAPLLPGCLGSSEPLELRIQNLGPGVDFEDDTLFLTATVDNGTAVQTILDTVTTGTLATFDSLVYVFSAPADFSAAGEYVLTVSLSFGPDQTLGDNSLTFDVVQIPVASLPSAVDFTGFTGSNLDNVFPGWYEGDGALVPDTTISSSWLEEDFANDPNSSNGSAAKIDLLGSTKQEWIVSPPFLATDSTYLTYDIAITESAGTGPGTLGSDDQVVVLISTDCGGSYQPLLTYDATTPVSNTGESVAIDLSAYDGQKVSVAFFGNEGVINDPENVDVFLDNLFIGTPDTIDMTALALLAPLDQDCGDSMAMGTLLISNRGILAADTIPVNITVVGPSGTTTLSDTLFGPLAFGASGSLTFGPFNTYAGGTYTIEAITGLGGDQNASNDTVSTTVFIRSLAPVNVLMPDSVCPGTSATLVVDDTLYANTEFVWFEAGTQVATGDTFITPALTSAATYTVQRIDQGTTAACETDPVSVTVGLLPAITADFSVDSTADLFASFLDASGNADSVRYLFGDGDSSSLPNPAHTYATAGIYDVCQIAFGECGPDTSCQQVTIICEPAVGGFAVDSTGDLFVALTDASLKADSVSYTFGDGTGSSTDVNPTYLYATAGTYVITQVAYHFCGNDTTELTVVIECAAAVPGFTTTQPANLTVALTSTAQNADSVVVDFGDGTVVTLTTADTTHTYDSAGLYTVCMTVYNLCGPVESCEEVNVINTSIGSVISSSVSLYPNPTKGEVELRLSLLRSTGLAVEVSDVRGRSLFRQDLGQQSGSIAQRLDLSHLSEGLYLFRIITADEVLVRKLRIE
jgi:PKD repeat protein